jgi:hypothetical protein
MSRSCRGARPRSTIPLSVQCKIGGAPSAVEHIRSAFAAMPVNRSGVRYQDNHAQESKTFTLARLCCRWRHECSGEYIRIHCADSRRAYCLGKLTFVPDVIVYCIISSSVGSLGNNEDKRCPPFSSPLASLPIVSVISTQLAAHIKSCQQQHISQAQQQYAGGSR